MRSGALWHRVKFYAKVTTRDTFGASVDSWPIATISTRGEVRWTGGDRGVVNEEKTYSRNMELTVRYRSTIVETMRVQLDGESALYQINYIEVIGRKESLRITLEKLSDGLPVIPVLPPTNFTATAHVADHHRIDLAWTNNVANDGVVIERSTNGNDWTEVTRIAKATIPVITYANTGLTPSTRYFYRIKHFLYYDYSAFAAIDDATTIA
jgi:head-tail adaptor